MASQIVLAHVRLYMHIFLKFQEHRQYVFIKLKERFISQVLVIQKQVQKPWIKFLHICTFKYPIYRYLLIERIEFHTKMLCGHYSSPHHLWKGYGGTVVQFYRFINVFWFYATFIPRIRLVFTVTSYTGFIPEIYIPNSLILPMVAGVIVLQNLSLIVLK